jgi:S-adenosylmethionine synthetase
MNLYPVCKLNPDTYKAVLVDSALNLAISTTQKHEIAPKVERIKPANETQFGGFETTFKDTADTNHFESLCAAIATNWIIRIHLHRNERGVLYTIRQDGRSLSSLKSEDVNTLSSIPTIVLATTIASTIASTTIASTTTASVRLASTTTHGFLMTDIPVIEYSRSLQSSE